MSTIPGLDDFENNNPFAEPTDNINNNAEANEQQDQQEIEQPQISYQDQIRNHNLEQEQRYYGSEVPEEQNQIDQNQIEQDSNDGERHYQQQLTTEELRKLLPERFTNKYHIHIKLTALERNKAGNPILKFDAFVKGLPRFRQDKYKDIRRTYNEIVKFNNYLTISNLEVFVPVIPLAITSYPSGGDEGTKQLMNVWQEWFNRITSNPILVRDEEFVFFIENDFGYSVINSNKKQSVASGLVRKTLKQLAVPYDPYEELSEFRPKIKSSYLTCQKLYKLLDKNNKIQKQLSIHVYELSQKLNSLSLFETLHPGMKNMWEKLAKITQIQSDLILVELVNDMGSLGDGVQALVNDFYQIKEALTNRHLIMRELIQAESQTKAKHQQANKIKNKSSLDPFKVDEAIRSLEYATKAEESLNLQVKRISGEMLFERKEVIEFTEQKFQKLLKNFTLHKVDHHRKILKYLENIRLDIRIIDEKGGLSRLNRDNLTSLKHNLTQSQSANGDSWSSRTFRSLTEQQEEQEKEKEQDNAKKSLDDIGEDSNLDDDRGVVDAKNAASLLGVATF